MAISSPALPSTRRCLSGGINFGHLFTDKANEPLLNQVSLIAQRPIDSNSKDVDFGFKVQLLYGSDARYTHFLGECDYCISNINQFDVVEAWGAVHLPYMFGGGIDVKAGQFVTLLGSEVINAPDNHLLFAFLHLQLRHPAQGYRRDDGRPYHTHC